MLCQMMVEHQETGEDKCRSIIDRHRGETGAKRRCRLGNKPSSAHFNLSYVCERVLYATYFMECRREASMSVALWQEWGYKIHT